MFKREKEKVGNNMLRRIGAKVGKHLKMTKQTKMDKRAVRRVKLKKLSLALPFTLLEVGRKCLYCCIFFYKQNLEELKDLLLSGHALPKGHAKPSVLRSVALSGSQGQNCPTRAVI